MTQTWLRRREGRGHHGGLATTVGDDLFDMTGELDGARSKELDAGHVSEMMKFFMENPWVQTCTRLIYMGMLMHGVGVYYGDERIHKLPRVLERWVRNKCIVLVQRAVEHLACMGFVIYEVGVDGLDVCVTDPRLVRVKMIRTPGEAMRYVIEPIDLVHQKSGAAAMPSYQICVMSEPDIMTGRTTGLLSRLTMHHLAVEIFVRNALVRDTGNSDATFLIETADKKAVDTYFNAVTENTSMGGFGGMAVPGMSRDADMLHDAREDATERILLHDMRVLRNMGGAPVRQLPGLNTRMMVEDINPSAFGFIPLSVGKTARQRIYPPANREFVASILHMERVIANTFGVPYSIVEKHTGNHSEAVDLENDLLRATCKMYADPVSTILENVSLLLFDPGESLDEILARFDHGSGPAVHIGAGDARVRAQMGALAAKGAEAWELRIVTMMSARECMLQYENGLLSHEAMIEFLTETTGYTADKFETRDVRPIMVPPELGGGAQGPGRKGAQTLTRDRTSEQRQSRDPSAAGARKRQKPGAD